VTVTEKTYSVSLADGTADATSWQGKKGDNGIYADLPIEGLKGKEKVVLKYNGHRKVKEVKATTASAIPVEGKFTINADGDQVSFAPGNLQYQPSTNTWRFALHQWDVVGSGNASISETYAGWIDLFGWGTSGHKFSSGYGSAYQPWSTSTTDQDYGTTSPNLYPLAGNFAQGDWGTNMGDGWRTLVAGEWKYLFDTRKGNDDGDRFAKAKVNGVCGVILLPDDWSRDYYDLTSYNMTAVIFDANVISLSDWTDKLALHGAVFLPAAGSRDGTTVDGVGSYGYYWSATPQNANNGWTVHLASDIVERKYIPRHDGASVRLVKAAE
jgi:hypothetical protein